MSQSQHHPHSLCVPLEYSPVRSLCTNTQSCTTTVLQSNSGYLSAGDFVELSNTVTTRILAVTTVRSRMSNSACCWWEKEICFLPFLCKSLKSSAQKISKRDFINCSTVQQLSRGKKEKDWLLESPISSASQVLSDTFYPILLH